MNYQKFETYYHLRHQQFEALADANNSFLENEEQHMWHGLLDYAAAGYRAKELFNSFDEKDIEVLLEGRVPMFILEIEYDDAETS
jgi:hypothetical protein